MHSTCLCCGHSNTQIGAAEVEQQKEMKKMQQWTETGQKRKDSGIVKVEREKSFWKGTVITIGCCCCHVREKAGTEELTGVLQHV